MLFTAGSITTFSGEANLCPKCNKKVYFAEKVTSLGKDWHRPCLRCERCGKTLAPGSHAEHDGMPYCHKPCYAGAMLHHCISTLNLNVSNVLNLAGFCTSHSNLTFLKLCHYQTTSAASVLTL
uniref:LIM zinc-binding domain-containing protein n=1 Tax=Periophthalmus magnuspinnatus TaxID=409849 RepID=A0A3B4A1V4_9GOBI